MHLAVSREPVARGGRNVGVVMMIRAHHCRARGRHGRLMVGLFLAVMLAGLAASAAEAKVWFGDLQGRELAWGHRVSSAIAGCPGNDSCRATVEGAVVYLRRGPVRTTGAHRRHLRRLGRISSSGRLSFRVPHVAPGRYHLVTWVTIGDWDRWMPVSGAFRVVRG
jgi:hypothetical protein